MCRDKQNSISGKPWPENPPEIEQTKNHKEGLKTIIGNISNNSWRFSKVVSAALSFAQMYQNKHTSPYNQRTVI